MVSISTRAHGAIDYLVSALLWGLARTDRFSPAVRRLLGAAPPAYVAYSALTDYEWGAVPVLSVPQHLALDRLSGLGFCAAGLLMRRERPAVRLMLFGIGASQLAVVALSEPDQRTQRRTR